jgi:predicted TIM-barrel fold metal-dependent hydrolase
MALFARLHRRRSGEANVLQAGRLAPDRIVMGAPKAFDERDDLGASFVKRTLEDISTHGYAFVGEIMFTHGDKTHGEQTREGERYVDPLGAGVLRLIEGLKARPVPVMTHWEVYDWTRDWPRLSEFYRRFPAQTFIWPHAGFADARQVDEVLSRHPNVVATLSKKEQDQRALSDNEKAAQLGPALVDGCGVLRPDWKELVLRHQDRFLFATDAHKDFRWRKYGDVVAVWRSILGQLPVETAEKIAYRNAQRVYAAR